MADNLRRHGATYRHLLAHALRLYSEALGVKAARWFGGRSLSQTSQAGPEAYTYCHPPRRDPQGPVAGTAGTPGTPRWDPLQGTCRVVWQ